MALLLNAGDTVSRSYSYTQPSPLHPSQPQETGDRTANLFDKDSVMVGGIDGDGSIAPNDNMRVSDYIRVNPNTVYAATYLTIAYYGRTIAYYDTNKNLISTASNIVQSEDGTATYTITTPNNCYYVRIATYVRVTNHVDDIMFNLGAAPLPYQPYGYKIPISSASTTIPVYLGEVQTRRKIGKYEFTGEETGWNVATSTTESGTYVFSIRYDVIGMDDIISYDKNMLQIPYPQFYSTHFKLKSNTSANNNYRDINNGEIGANSVISGAWNYNRYIVFATNQCGTVNDFIQFLAAQYAAGTPVTVWYVLANEETAVINEPLMKIGDYADTVSGITIPTTAGANTLSIGTTLQPSEVTVNYKGWHPVQSVHEYDSNYTIATMQALTIAQLQTHTISDLQGGEWS